MYFVYVNWNGKVLAQKWAEMWTNLEIKKVYEHLSAVKLTEDEYGMSLAELVKKYPPELKE